FLREARRVLQPDGKLVLTDILFRRPLVGVPTNNLWTNEADYRAKCASVGLVVEIYQDLTDCTVRPFWQHIAANGKRAHAIAQRRAISAYCLVVLRKAC